MNSERCPKCHTVFTTGPTNCPVCGNGSFSPDPTKHVPDEPIFGPERIINFCKAMRKRMDVTSSLMKRFSIECQVWSETDPVMLPQNRPEFLQTFDLRLLAATQWTPFANLPLITDPMRGIVCAYHRIYEDLATVRINSNGFMDTKSRVAKETESALALAPQLEQMARFSIDLLECYQSHLKADDDGSDDILFMLQDRYYINTYAAGFALLENAADDVDRYPPNSSIDDRLIYDARMALQILKEATNARKIQPVPPNFAQTVVQTQLLADAITHMLKDAIYTIENISIEQMVVLYRLWNPAMRADVESLQRISIQMGAPMLH